MSDEKNRDEAIRWLKTAMEDLDASRILAANGKYSHACFLSQQAAEKSVKAIYYFNDEDPWGHSVYKLIAGLETVDSKIYNTLSAYADNGKALDKLYIPTRYPNGLPDIIPSMAYTEQDARQALLIGKEIIDAVIGLMNLQDLKNG